MKLEELKRTYEAEGWLIEPENLTFGKVLGRGASGLTYRGEFDGKTVAIKSYSPEMLQKDAESVRKEMDIMAKLKHPNVVEFCGLYISCNPPTASLVTKFAPRGELGHALYPKSFFKALMDTTRYHIAIGLAKGLQYLHGKKIVHRDLKPANVLLGEDCNPMVTDFGFSRFIDTSAPMTGETGSYRYMAPEMIRHESYNEKVDVYSFGVLVNEIFARVKPFPDLLPVHAALGVARNSRRPSQKNISNERLKRLIQKCWAQKSEERPGWDWIIRELEDLKRECKVEEDTVMAKMWKSVFN